MVDLEVRSGELALEQLPPKVQLDCVRIVDQVLQVDAGTEVTFEGPTGPSLGMVETTMDAE